MDTVIEEATKQICSIAGVEPHEGIMRKQIAAIIEHAIAQDKKQTRERLQALWGEGVS